MAPRHMPAKRAGPRPVLVALLLAAAGAAGARRLADDDFHFTQCNENPVGPAGGDLLSVAPGRAPPATARARRGAWDALGTRTSPISPPRGRIRRAARRQRSGERR
jgi:hypothetical protein